MMNENGKKSLSNLMFLSLIVGLAFISIFCFRNFYVLAISFITSLIPFFNKVFGNTQITVISEKKRKPFTIDRCRSFLFGAFLFVLSLQAVSALRLFLRAEKVVLPTSFFSLYPLLLGIIFSVLFAMILISDKEKFAEKERKKGWLCIFVLLMYLVLSFFHLEFPSDQSCVAYDMVSEVKISDFLLDNPQYVPEVVVFSFLLFIGFVVSIVRDVRIGKKSFWPVAAWLFYVISFWITVTISVRAMFWLIRIAICPA